MVVSAGDVIPVDGEVTEGRATVDEQLLIGESAPSEKAAGDRVLALSAVREGRLLVRVERTGTEAAAWQMAQILDQTSDFTEELEARTRRIADRTVWPFFLLGGALLPFRGVVVTSGILRSHVGHRATIVTSIALLNFLNLASRKGVLVKDGHTFERLKKVDTVVFEMDSSLIEAEPRVSQIHTYNGFTAQDVLTYAAVAEVKQTRPVARAIMHAAEARGIVAPHSVEVEYLMGYGLTARVARRLAHVGNTRFMALRNIDMPASIQRLQAECDAEGATLIVVAVERRVAGAIVMHMAARPEAREAIQALRQRRIQHIYMIANDHAVTAQKLAQELGIDRYFIEMLPENKALLLDQWRLQGRTVCYVGDGVNDTIALQHAAVSISIGGASTVAVDAAHAVLLDGSLKHVCDVFDIAIQFDRNLKTTFVMIVGASLAILGSVLTFPLTPLQIALLTQFSVLVGVANSVFPLLQQELRALIGTEPGESSLVRMSHVAKAMLPLPELTERWASPSSSSA